MKSPGETVTDLVNRRVIEEVPEEAVSDRAHVVADQMLVSIAMSFKRIADALDPDPAAGPKASLYGLASDLAFHMGQAFENGRRQA